MRAVRNVAIVVTLLLVAGCGSDDGSPETTTQPPSATQPQSSTPQWAASLFNSASSSPTQATLTAEISDAEFQRLLEDLRSWSPQKQSIVNDLEAINSFWIIRVSDITSFVNDWCNVNYRQATAGLLNKLPGADISAMPALNRVIALISLTCSPKPEALDDTSNIITARLATATLKKPTPTTSAPYSEPATSKGSLVYKAFCAGIDATVIAGLKEQVKQWRNGGYWVVLGLAAITVYCPSILERVFSQ